MHTILSVVFRKPELSMTTEDKLITEEKEKAGRKSYTAEEKAQALQMLKEGATLKAVIEKFNCAAASIQNWKKQAKEKGEDVSSVPGVKKAAKKAAKKTGKKPGRKKKAVHTAGSPQHITGGSDAFIRDYWKGSKAIDILMAHPDSGAEIIKLVNEGLAHSYAKLGKD